MPDPKLIPDPVAKLAQLVADLGVEIAAVDEAIDQIDEQIAGRFRAALRIVSHACDILSDDVAAWIAGRSDP